MIKKKGRKLGTTESSSSEVTVPSTPPKDVLELGMYLVRELGIEETTDTLGRWLAHQLAELIQQANEAKDANVRSEARSHATDLILKIWEHRAVVPGTANPLRAYEPILNVLRNLGPNANPWLYHNRPFEKIAADIYDPLSRLVIGLLILDCELCFDSHQRRVAVKFLSPQEQDILKHLKSWLDLFPVGTESPETLSGSTQSRVDVVHALRDLVEDTIAILQRARGYFQEQST